MSRPSHVTPGMLVVQTVIVCRGREMPPVHYQIELAEHADPRTPRLVFITKDEAIYEHALSIEDTDVRIDATWHVGQKWNGKPAQILTSLKRTERQKRGAA